MVVWHGRIVSILARALLLPQGASRSIECTSSLVKVAIAIKKRHAPDRVHARVKTHTACARWYRGHGFQGRGPLRCGGSPQDTWFPAAIKT